MFEDADMIAGLHVLTPVLTVILWFSSASGTSLPNVTFLRLHAKCGFLELCHCLLNFCSFESTVVSVLLYCAKT